MPETTADSTSLTISDLSIAPAAASQAEPDLYGPGKERGLSGPLDKGVTGKRGCIGDHYNEALWNAKQAAASVAQADSLSQVASTLDQGVAGSLGGLNGDSTAVIPKGGPKGRTGRPTEYKPCLIKKLYDYFNGFASDGTHVLPTFEHFGQIQRLSHQAFNEWRVSHTDFGAAYRNCLEIQKQWLTNGALSERYHPGFTKFLMINNHGMVSDNAVQQVNSNVNANISGGITVRFVDSTSSI